MTVDTKRLGEARYHAFGDYRGVFGLAQVIEHQRKFVAAEPCHRISRAQAFTKAQSHLCEHLISAAVAKLVVDRLEPIHIHENHAHRALLSTGLPQGLP